MRVDGTEMVTVGEILRARLADMCHVFEPNDLNVRCHRCDGRRGDPVHWSRDDDRHEIRRQFDKANPEWRG